LRGLVAQASLSVTMQAEVRSPDLKEHGDIAEPVLPDAIMAAMGSSSAALAAGSARVPCAAPTMAHVEWRVPGLRSFAMACCSSKTRTDRVTAALHNALLDDWDEKHRVIQHDDLDKLGGKPPSRKCFMAGVCFCDDKGKVLAAMGRRFSTILRSQFAKGKAGRSYMESFSIAFLIYGDAGQARAAHMLGDFLLKLSARAPDCFVCVPRRVARSAQRERPMRLAACGGGTGCLPLPRCAGHARACHGGNAAMVRTRPHCEERRQLVRSQPPKNPSKHSASSRQPMCAPCVWPAPRR